MFSAVLLMALSGGADAHAWGGRGCHGCHAYSGCHGYSGCHAYAGCHHRSRSHGCSGRRARCHGGSYVSACHGCYASSGCTGAYSAPPAPPAMKAPESIKKPPAAKPPQPEARGPAPATLSVSLPPDARLFIDGAPTSSTSAARVFISPPLTGDDNYSYTLKAEVIRNGQTVTETQKVPVRPGETTNVVLLEFPAPTVVLLP
jgi:uncharacterized protein (TIGR03000 family)